MLCSASLLLMNTFSLLAAFIQIPSVINIFDLDAKCGGFPSYEIVFTHNSYSNFVIHRVWGEKMSINGLASYIFQVWIYRSEYEIFVLA